MTAANVAPGSWLPHAAPPGQRYSGQELALMVRGVPRVLLDGGRGGGKTGIACARFCLGLGIGPAWVGMVLRRRFKELSIDVLPKIRAFVARHYGPESSNPARFYESTSDYFFEWRTGERLLLRHAFDERGYWDFHGSEVPFQFFDEAASWIEPLKLADMMRSLMRSPDPRVNAIKIQMLATNPHGPGAAQLKAHFVRDVNKRMELFEPDPHVPGDTLRARIHLPLSENRVLLDAQPDYAETTIAPMSSEAIRRAWMGGPDRWEQALGGFFAGSWARAVHVLGGPLSFGADWRYRRGFDWGFSAPSACVFAAIAQRDTTFRDGERVVHVKRNSVVVFAEWYPLKTNAAGVPQYNKGRELAALAQGAELARASRSKGVAFSGCVADPSIFPAQGRERGLYEDLVRGAQGEGYALQFDRADNGRVVGWLGILDLLAGSLSEAERAKEGKGHAEQPSLYISAQCPHLIRCLEAAPRDEKDPDDVDSKSEDHLLDALRYLTNSTGANQATPGTLRTH